MAAEVIVYVDTLDSVALTTKNVANSRGQIVTSTVRNVARVITREGRKAIAVGVLRNKDGEINQVICKYVSAPEGDVVGQRCVRDGEQRQHYPGDLTIYAMDEGTPEETPSVEHEVNPAPSPKPVTEADHLRIRIAELKAVKETKQLRLEAEALEKDETDKLKNELAELEKS